MNENNLHNASDQEIASQNTSQISQQENYKSAVGNLQKKARLGKKKKVMKEIH